MHTILRNALEPYTIFIRKKYAYILSIAKKKKKLLHDELLVITKATRRRHKTKICKCYLTAGAYNSSLIFSVSRSLQAVRVCSFRSPNDFAYTIRASVDEEIDFFHNSFRWKRLRTHIKRAHKIKGPPPLVHYTWRRDVNLYYAYKMNGAGQRRAGGLYRLYTIFRFINAV